MMNSEEKKDRLDELDLRQVATILQGIYPDYSLCECARMAADFAPTTGCVCSICAPGTYPDCVRRKLLQGAHPPGAAAAKTGS